MVDRRCISMIGISISIIISIVIINVFENFCMTEDGVYHITVLEMYTWSRLVSTTILCQETGG